MNASLIGSKRATTLQDHDGMVELAPACDRI
jgi:hypothetical protein